MPFPTRAYSRDSRFQHLEPLDQHGHALAAADAEGRQAELLVLVLEKVPEGDQDARAAGPDGVAEGDGWLVGLPRFSSSSRSA